MLILSKLNFWICFGRLDVMPHPLKALDVRSVLILEFGTMKLQSLLRG